MDIECLLIARLCLTIHGMVLVVAYRADWMTNTSYETFSFRIEPSIFQEKRDYCIALRAMSWNFLSGVFLWCHWSSNVAFKLLNNLQAAISSRQVHLPWMKTLKRSFTNHSRIMKPVLCLTRDLDTRLIKVITQTSGSFQQMIMVSIECLAGFWTIVPPIKV